MTTLKMTAASLCLMVAFTAATAQTEPLGGQPPIGSKASAPDLSYQVKYQRAFEVALWALPAVAIYRFRSAAFDDLGLKDNDIIAYSTPATPKLEAITANSTTPYITAFADLKKEPVVLELPPAGPDGSLYGQVVDAWQLTIADVGPSGLDKGKGGKYLFTPPGYAGTVPKGYIQVKSPSYRIALAFRSVIAKGKTAKDAYAYSKHLKMYNLSQSANPPKQRFVDPANERYATLPFYDERYFNDVYDIFTYEPSSPDYKVIMGMLSTLGIERGKPFNPDETTKKAMRQAAVDAWAYLQSRFDNLPQEAMIWPDRHYASLLLPDKNKKFTYDDGDRIAIDMRAMMYFWCTYVPKEVSDKPPTAYLMALRDKNGDALAAGKTYKVTVPANMPVKQFWAVTVYDRATNSFIYTKSNRTTLSSYDLPKMKKNADGSVTLYVGPAAPAGEEANWIPTEGKRPLPAVRLYGPTEEFNNKSFKMPDFELVRQ
ncbi:DUF1254 domain-containing protein [Jeongeupia sp. USM3]|uniref:DUF1254 domain-containing protein n=1 Tax=Jeongeupia sp. USM3 TaxID=1906741 RepID=UPI00089DFCBD|nr:DUF1254 domain-containing protein [Jeongeupia sp. USM3]AOX99333.1 hypothetical protein BJP62_02015 [Jeongeupia sp. USM3]